MSIVFSIVYSMATHEKAASFADECDKFIELRALRNALYVGSIVAIEKGKYSSSLELAFRIARAFDVPLEEVFFLEEDNS